MTALTLRGLFSRKLRAGLTALAVLLGVMMISGTYVFTDTINHSFDRIFETANKGIALKVVSHKNIDTQDVAVPPFDESLLARVKAVDGVAVAAGVVSDTATIFDDNGKRANKGQAPSLLFSASPKPFTPLSYSEGLPPSGPNDVTIDTNTAKRLGFHVGDIVRVGAKTPVKRYRISGLGKFGDVSSFGGATIVVPALAEAQRITDKRGKLDQIDVAVAPGAEVANVQAGLRRALPQSVDVRTGAEDAQKQSDDIHSSLSFLNVLLLAFAGIALFVGAFIIFNTFSITVAQRTTEFGLLRTMGASRRQILRSVVLESLVIGLGASVAGLFAGILAAKGISALFKALNVDLPSQGTVLLPRTIIVSLVVGTVVTVIAGLGPARRATRVSPLAALRHDVAAGGRTGRRRTIVAGVVTALGAVLLAIGLFAASGASGVLGLMAVGAILVFIGTALLSNRLVPPIASAIGWPIERLRGVAGRLARENSVRNPGRTAVTAAALMIGLALVTFVTVLAAGLRASINDAIDESFAGDLVLSNKDGGSPIPTAAGRAVAQIPGVAAASPLNASVGEVRGVSGTTPIQGVDPATFSKVWKPKIKKGPGDVFDTLRPREAVLVDDWAKSNHYKVGQKLLIKTPAGTTIPLTVRGTVDNKGDFFDSIATTTESVRRDFRQQDDDVVLVRTAPGADLKAVQARVDRLLDARFPVVRSQDQKQFKDDIAGQVNQLLALIYALLSLSIIVSLFGIVNTLVLSIHERTREIGMMRAIGTSRRQIRRIVRYESVITAMIGGVLGLVVGLLLGAMTTVALADQGFTLQIPVANLVIFMVVVVVAGVLAAIPPARRASRLDVLESLAYE